MEAKSSKVVDPYLSVDKHKVIDPYFIRRSDPHILHFSFIFGKLLDPHLAPPGVFS